MTLQQKLTDEMKAGMRAGDTDRVSVIRLLRASIKNKEIEKGKGQTLSDEEILQVIASAVKQRKESIEQFAKGGREDLVEKEKRELAILQSFLPQPISDEELRLKIREAIAEAGATDIKQMGMVMKILMPRLVGKAEGNAVSQMVRTMLEKK
ncbi:MAG TPA: GatB/YqeY domain-containing protein [Candidatus Manganitrophaceae bacterium]|nr:GatB/YqeY domain-containing protein [Candidatus Manganitrophaceae bacterium]